VVCVCQQQDARTSTDLRASSAAQASHDPKEQVAVKKITNVFSKQILAKRALREIKLLQHFRGHRNVSPSHSTRVCPFTAS
jgi:mitogen-activated protein kinase 7